MFDIQTEVFKLFRNIMWIVVKLCLELVDYVYGLLTGFFGLNLTDFSWIWKWVQVLTALLGFFILIRLVIMYIKTMIDDDAGNKIAPASLLRRMVVIGLIFVLIPVTLPSLSKLSSDLAVQFPKILNLSDAKPSGIVLASSNTAYLTTEDAGTVDNTATLYLTENWKSIDNLNEKDDDGNYKYLPNSADLIVCVALTIMVTYIFFMLCIQVIQRLIGLIFKMILSPYALSGLVDPDDTGFKTWLKLVMADLLTNFFQVVFIWLVFEIISTIQLNPIPKIIFFIGALLAILNAPAGLSQLLGADIGTATAMQSMQSMQTLSKVVSTGAKVAGATTAIAGGLALAGAKNINTTASIMTGTGTALEKTKDVMSNLFDKNGNFSTLYTAGKNVGDWGRRRVNDLNDVAKGMGDIFFGGRGNWNGGRWGDKGGFHI